MNTRQTQLAAWKIIGYYGDDLREMSLGQPCKVYVITLSKKRMNLRCDFR
jgi:hypothetical protein